MVNGLIQDSIVKDFQGLRAHYDAARTSRFARTKTGLGGAADVHYNHADLWRLREYSREMIRNGMLPFGAWIDQAAAQCVGDGFRLEPDTGDAQLNSDIKRLWKDWSEDATRCDMAGQLTFWQMEHLLDVSELADGDIFVNPLANGRLELLEADRCLSPFSQASGVYPERRPGMHIGVQKNKDGRPLRYWFAAYTPRHAGNVDRAKMKPIEAWRDGEVNLFHVYDPRRVGQTRGIPVLAAAMIAAGMAEDLTFAQLVKNQVAACVALFITRDASAVQLGPQEDDELDGSNTETLESMAPGMIVRAKNGERIDGFAPNMPNAEWGAYWQQLVRILGIHLGLPLEQSMWDMSQTNFSGMRMAVQEAHKRVRYRQRNRIARFHRPVYRWWLRRHLPQLALSSAGVRNLQAMGEDLFRHKWILPRREYIEPTKDVKADRDRMRNGLDSPRDIVAERGIQWDELVRETVEDNALAISAAAEKADELNARYTGLNVTWRDVLNWDTADGLGNRVAAPQTAAPAAGRQEETD